MEVVTMLFLIVVAVILTTVAVVFLLPDPDQEPDAGPPRTDAEPSGGSGAPPPTTLEGALVAQLLAAEISRSQYRRAVARLAERDDERNPVSVPGTGGPDACV